MRTIDFGRHSEDYARYRPGFPRSFYERLEMLAPLCGRSCLDLATGPGIIGLELASRGAEVVGVDLAPGQVVAAKSQAVGRGLEDRTHFLVGSAEALGLGSNTFDWVTAGQCWHWFDQRVVLAEVSRVLRPGGHLVIADYSYLAEHSALARETEALVLSFHPRWTMAGASGVDAERIDDVIRSGLCLVEAFCYDHEEAFSHERWRGRMRTCNGVGSGGLSPSEVQRFDQELEQLLVSKYPDPVIVEHRVWCVVARKP